MKLKFIYLIFLFLSQQSGFAQIAPPFTQCPPVGASSACAVLIVITDFGLTFLSDTSQGVYDGDDDTLVGVVNMSSKSVESIRLSGGSTPIFGFDGDGLCTYISCAWPHPTGYEGPGVTFNVLGSDATLGIVVFDGSLAPGESRYFSLESAIRTVCPPLAVDLLKQSSPRWGSFAYDHTQKRISALGCALTSSAMTINYQAAQQGLSFSTDPETLNEWLNLNGGYSRAGGLIFPAVARYAQRNGVSLYYKAPISGEDNFAVLNFLCTGEPVTLVVKSPHRNHHDHYVLATGELSVPNATPISDFLINDPGFNNSTLAGYGNAYHGIRPFSNISTGEPTALVIQAFSPVQLLVTDPQGHRVGTDPVTGKSYAESPNAGCVREQLDDDDDANPNATPQPENLSCEFANPMEGTYSVKVIGTGSGPYTLDFISFDRAGRQSTKTFTGTAISNVTAPYTINFSASSSDRTQVTARCAGDVNGDGVVDVSDLRLLQGALGSRQGQSNYLSQYDLNRDGVVNVEDLAILSRNLGCTTQTK